MSGARSGQRIVFASRGDLVYGRLLAHPSADRRPLVLALAPDGACDHPVIERAFDELGAAASVASIDLAHCGARRDKLSPVIFDDAHPLAARLLPDREQQLAADLTATFAFLQRPPARLRTALLLAIGARPALVARIRLDADIRLLEEPAITPALFAALRSELDATSSRR